MRLPAFLVTALPDVPASAEAGAFGGAVYFSSPAPTVAITGPELAHLRGALRLSVGDQVELGERGSSSRAVGTIASISEHEAEVSLTEYRKSTPAAKRSIRMLVGLLQPQLCDFLVEKYAELGIDELIFFQAVRTKTAAKDFEKRQPRLSRVADAARKQSGLGSYLQLNFAKNLRSGLTELHASLESNHAPTGRILLVTSHEVEAAIQSFQSAGKPMMSENLKQKRLLKNYFDPIYGLVRSADQSLLQSHAHLAEITCVLGPEGGFDSEEVSEALGWGYQPTSLGERVLRAETAALVTGAILRLWTDEGDRS